MRTLLLILGLVALARLSHAQAGPWAGLISARADSNDIRMAKLNEELDDIANTIGGLGGAVSTEDLGARVRQLTGDGCGEKEFQCGGDAPQCISNLAVCDNVKDCRNGADEEASKGCKNPAYPGTAWSGTIHWSSCSATPETGIRVVVNTADRKDWFPSRVLLEATVIMEQGGEYETKTTTGFYNYGNQRLVFQPTGEKNVGVICEFDGVDCHRCTGTVVKPNLDKCADVVLVRK